MDPGRPSASAIDLLHQRQDRRSAGLNLEDARVQSAEVVEQKRPDKSVGAASPNEASSASRSRGMTVASSASIAAADALLIATPEDNHCVPGVVENAD